MFRQRLLTSSAVLAVLGSAIAVAPTTASASTAGVARQINAAGVTSFAAAGSTTGTDVGQPELGPGYSNTVSASGNTHGSQVRTNRSRSIELGSSPVDTSPVTAGQGVSSTGPLPVSSTFDGLDHFQQRWVANGGKQFSVEPPDQGLCAGSNELGTNVMETVNSVARVYGTDGKAKTGVMDLNTFLGYIAQDNRATHTEGPFVTDPSCYYDKDTNRWFVDVLTIEVFPTASKTNNEGDFTGVNHLDIAVSQTSDPTGAWTIYRIPVQDDGTQGTPNHGCTGIAPYGQFGVPTNPNACLGDYPHIGADANGIYLTTNEYSFFGNDFHGAQIYAFSKRQLAANALTGAPISVDQFDTHGLDNGNSGFTIWPATAPNDLNSSANGGTEYFLSSNAADEAHGNGASQGPRTSNQLLVWSLTNTSRLGGSRLPVLSHSTLSVGQYVVPARSEQKSGETPLIDCLNQNSCATNFELGVPDPFAPEHEASLDSNDTRMQQVVFADGRLYGALDTAVRSNANVHAGVEWFVVNPTAAGGPQVVNNGYLAATNNNITYPAIAVNSDGHGVMAFTLLGRDFYPSAAFASMSASGPGAIQVAAAGLGPDDGFTDTAVFNAPNPTRPRWGDYGAAVVDGSNIWMASEYIGQTCDLRTYLTISTSPHTFGLCGDTRSALANWDTRISEVTP